MAICPRCKHKISWRKFVFMDSYNVKHFIICSNCKAYLKPKYWMIWELILIIILVFFILFFLWLAESFHISFIFLFVIWLIISILLHLIFSFIKYEEMKKK